MPQSPDPVIVASYVRQFSVEQLDGLITEVGAAYLTSSITTVTALGITTGSDPAQTALVLATLEAARTARVIVAGGAAAAAAALDAIPAMSHGLDFSRRGIE